MALKPFTGELYTQPIPMGGLKPFTGELDAPSMGDTIAGLPITRLAMGAASPLIGAAQLGAHVGDTANEVMGTTPVVSPWIDAQLARYKSAQERGMKAAGTEGYNWMGLLGSLAPTSLMAKGIGTALPQATSIGGRMGVGAVQGGAAAAAQPIENTEQGFWSPKVVQTAAGTLIGGAVPIAIDAVNGIGKIVQQAAQPFTEKGRAAILQDFRNAIMGHDPAAKARMIQEAANAQPGMGGVMPTVGEVTSGIPESTGLAAHQADIARLTGNSTEFAKRLSDQQAARADAIGSIAKTPADLESAIAHRGRVANQLYGTAEKQVLTPDQALDTLFSRPSMKSVLNRAAELAKEKGDAFKIGQDLPERVVTSPIVSASGQPIQHTLDAEVAKYPVKSLHYVKMAMDDLIKDPERFGIGANEAQAIAGTQKQFVNWLSEKSPAYRLARETYKNMSGPIDRMQVGQVLEKALTSPLGTSERSGMMANAVRESARTLKKATGQPRFDQLNEVLNPQEMGKVQQVASELAKSDAYKRLAHQTSLSGRDAIPGDLGVPLPNLLYRPAMIANFMMKHVAKGAEEKIGKLAAQQYLNPPEFAKAMQSIPPRYQPMIDALMQQLPAVAGTLAGRSQ